MLKYSLSLLTPKHFAMVSHLALGGVWTLLFFFVRIIFPEQIKDIIALHASFVLFSFLFSLGFSTLVRLLAYEKQVQYLKDAVFLCLVFQFLLSLFCFALPVQYGAAISMTAVYNSFFILVNVSIAKGAYHRTAVCCAICVLIVLLGFLAVLFERFEYLLFGSIFSITSLALFIWRRFYIDRGETFRLSRGLFLELARGPAFLVSTFPLRLSIFSLGWYFSSSVSSQGESEVYADALVYFGIVSVFSGRYFLFNEQSIKSLAQKSSFLFGLYQFFIILPFFLYELNFSEVSPKILLLVGLLYSSREIFGIHVAFLKLRTRILLVGSYGVVSLASWVLVKNFGEFLYLAPTCAFFTAYYLIVQPLRRGTYGDLDQKKE